jgi:hypothetical protein
MRTWMPLLVLLAACDRKSPAPAPAPAPAVAPVAAPSAEASPRDAAVKAFWQWFAKNAAALHDDKDAVGVMNKITDELKKVDERVIGEIALAKDTRTLVLSADGVKEAFPAVQALYAARPVSVAGWRVEAFRQRMSAGELDGMQFKMDGKEYKPSQIAFVATRAGDKLDVELFSPTEDVSKPAKTMMFVMLDHVIGEYDSETKIGGIDFSPKSKAPKDARPLPALAHVLDEAFPRAK